MCGSYQSYSSRYTGIVYATGKKRKKNRYAATHLCTAHRSAGAAVRKNSKYTYMHMLLLIRWQVPLHGTPQRRRSLLHRTRRRGPGGTCPWRTGPGARVRSRWAPPDHRIARKSRCRQAGARRNRRRHRSGAGSGDGAAGAGGGVG